ncbi:BLUF domain-containing protein [Phenylobacterium sp. 20VBR1]|uniref:BLUF domain-containing protein n=1 Tax=Phenylobacterium glaciei TaxID=2803784 RepID=A0A941D064_9CAUL|nr:BLUF domain-containing protein [Phenylobacterium glaciei]MBR7617948.1 BLUF domain-containing protein [Phenylobacterium glaciei]QQZ50542.1 BLUF domain-containing protein [Phenylobacterium glaciei]
MPEKESFMLHCIGYLSTSRELLTTLAVTALVAQASHANKTRQVTGMLCYHDGTFLQFIEGARSSLDELMGKIRRDERHTGIIQVHDKPIEARLFPQWSMSLVRTSRLNPAQLAGFQDLRTLDVRAPGAPSHAARVADFLEPFRLWLR